MSKVIVGLSGGVDSSVAAYLLKEQGHEVIGLFMKNWHDDSVTISDECPWLEDSNDALIVAEKLGIPFQTIDLSTQYKEKIVDYMFHEYEHGRTPNPDVLCNREIKFDVFLETALKLGADFVATGHYVRKSTSFINGEETYHLLTGVDENKDQSYFLCQLNQAQLSKALFPIGELKKTEVREIAKKAGLVTAHKKDSQGLCFIGKVHLPDFLQQKLLPKTGKVVQVSPQSTIYQKKTPSFSNDSTFEELESICSERVYHFNAGKTIGEHRGAHYFTIGQRKGLGIGGTKEPLFVIATDVTENIIYVGEGENHPGLFRQGFFIPVEDMHWVRPDMMIKLDEPKRFLTRIRYRQSLEWCTIIRKSDQYFFVFDNCQRAVAKGQFVAFYDQDELIGSGVIS